MRSAITHCASAAKRPVSIQLRQRLNIGYTIPRKKRQFSRRKKNPAELRRVFCFGQRIAPAAHLASAADQNVSSMDNILATNRFHGAFSKTAYQSRRNIDGG